MGGRRTHRRDQRRSLCERHHTLVPQRRLWGEVRELAVVWDLTDGSYDRALAAIPPPGRAPDPPPGVDDGHHLDTDSWWDVPMA